MHIGRQFTLPVKEMINYVKKNNPNFHHCKLLQYDSLNKANQKTPYASVKSKKQMQTIINFSHTKTGFDAYTKLTSLLIKHFRINRRMLNKILNPIKSDNEIYQSLKQFIKSKHKKEINFPIEYYPKSFYECNRELIHAQQMVYKIQEHIFKKNPDYVIGNYLDIGCGDCIKTRIIGEKLKLNIKNIYGADLTVWGGYAEEKRQNLGINLITVEENKPLPIETDKFGLTSAFMVLHHVKNLDLFLRELNRVTKLGGFILIREHDCFTNMDAMLIDIEHALYDVSYRDDKSFFDKYYAQYYNYIEWDYIFERYGFKYHYANYDSANINFTVSSTRYYYCFYRKVKEVQEIGGIKTNEDHYKRYTQRYLNLKASS